MNTFSVFRCLRASSLALTLTASLAFAGPTDGTVVGAVKIFDNGPDTDRFVLVLIAEGYREDQLVSFAQRAEEFVEALVVTPPFDKFCTALNVYRIDVASDQTGADDPTDCDGSGNMVDTYFDATFCGDNEIRRALVVNDATAVAVMNAMVPGWDQGIVIVNSFIHGGTGGTPGTISVAGDWVNIAIHEVGHSVFGLADEYEYWAGCSSGETDRDSHPGPEPMQANVTLETDPNLVKWRHLFYPSIPVPTTVNADCSECDSQPDPFPDEVLVGLYEGAHYHHCDAYRPTFHCMMRNFAPFCPVCVERITLVIAPYLPPNQAPVCDTGGPYVVECTGGLTPVLLDGSGSADDGCLPLTFTWTGGFVEGNASGETVSVQFPGVGSYPVQLAVSDGSLSSNCDTTVTVEDTIPPALVAPADVEVECTSHDGTPVDLGTPFVADVCDSNPEVDHDAPLLFMLGETIVTWTATDGSGNSSQDTQSVTVVDTTPPEVFVSVSPDSLWPPNHKWITITATVIAEDLCDPAPVIRLVSIVSNEPANSIGDGNTDPDVRNADFGTEDYVFDLRAERQGTSTGRVYTITYEAEDSSGNVGSAQATVTVAHDQKK